MRDTEELAWFMVFIFAVTIFFMLWGFIEIGSRVSESRNNTMKNISEMHTDLMKQISEERFYLSSRLSEIQYKTGK